MGWRTSVAVAGVMVVVGAKAQAAPGTDAPAPTVSPQQRAQAAAYLKTGKGLYVKHRYEDALTVLRRSYELAPSPATRVSISHVFRAMGRVVAAYNEMTQALEEAKPLAATSKRYAELVKKWTSERAALEQTLAFVTVMVGHPAEETTVHVGGGVIDRRLWGEKIAVAPGTLEIVVATPDREPVRQSVSLAATEAKTVEVDAGAAPTQLATPEDVPETEPANDVLTPGKEGEPQPSAPTGGGDGRTRLRPYGWIAGGVGLIGIGTFVGFGLMAKSRYSDLRASCDPTCPPSKADEVSSGRTAETIANVGLAVGILGVVSSVALFTLAGTKRDGSASARASLVVGPSFVGLRGSM